MSNERERAGEEVAYEATWYRVLKALSEGEAIEIGTPPDHEIAIITFDPEADRPDPVRLSG
jgi:hypothetical protein